MPYLDVYRFTLARKCRVAIAALLLLGVTGSAAQLREHTPPSRPYEQNEGVYAGGMTLGESLILSTTDLQGVLIRVGGQLVVADELQLGADQAGRLMFAWVRYTELDGTVKTLDYRARAAALFNDVSSVNGVMIIDTNGAPFWAESPVFGKNSGGELALLSKNALEEYGGATGAALATLPPQCINATAAMECVPTDEDGCINEDCENRCTKKEKTEGANTYFYCECLGGGLDSGCLPMYTLTCPTTGCNAPDHCAPKLSMSGKCHCL